MAITLVNKDEDIASPLIQNIKLLLNERGLSIRQLSEALNGNLSPMTISRIINGVTKNPGIDALELLADYFNVSIDDLIKSNLAKSNLSKKKAQPRHLPIVSLEDLSDLESIESLDLMTWKNWQTVSANAENEISSLAFTIITDDTFYPRFPAGARLIFDPKEAPQNNDLVLVKHKLTNKVELRELKIDPPIWECQSLLTRSNYFKFEQDLHEVMGVNVLTIFYGRS